MKSIRRVQKYLDGEMSSNELEKFKMELKTNPKLKEQMDLQRQIYSIVEKQGQYRFRNKLDKIYKEYVQGSVSEQDQRKKYFYKKYFFYAAATILFAGFIAIQLISPGIFSHKNIYSEYYSKFQQDIQVRSVAEESSDALSAGLYHYYNNEYAQSIEELTDYIAKDPIPLAYFYRGLSEQENGNFRDAINDYSIVMNSEFNYYQEHSNWYLGLCYIKLGEYEKAKDILNNITSDSVYSDEAAKIIKFLH